jgi:hypothetical protein
MKSEVYSWRVSTDIKANREREARRRGISLAAVLDLAVEEWLKKSAAGIDDDVNQLRLRQAALECIGSLAGGDPLRSQNAGTVGRLSGVDMAANALIWRYSTELTAGHQPCVDKFQQFPLPMKTSEAALTELFHLVVDDQRETEAPGS